VSLWSKATAARIKASITPETIDQAHAALMRPESIPQVTEVETPNGQKAHTWPSPRQVKQLIGTCDD
jgi:hypothetical protein